jgi:hypothetical protein
MTMIFLLTALAAFSVSYWASEKERACVRQSDGLLKSFSRFSVINWMSAAIGLLMVFLAFFT